MLAIDTLVRYALATSLAYVSPDRIAAGQTEYAQRLSPQLLFSEQCTVDVAEPRTDSGATAAGRDMGADSELEADGCAGVCDADGAAVDGGAADTGTHTHTDARADEGQDRP